MRELMKKQIAAVRAQTHEATHQVKLTELIRDRKNQERTKELKKQSLKREENEKTI